MQVPDHSELIDFEGQTLAQCIMQCNEWAKDNHKVITGMISSIEIGVPFTINNTTLVDKNQSIVKLVVAYTIMKSI